MPREQVGRPSPHINPPVRLRPKLSFTGHQSGSDALPLTSGRSPCGSRRAGRSACNIAGKSTLKAKQPKENRHRKGSADLSRDPSPGGGDRPDAVGSTGCAYPAGDFSGKPACAHLWDQHAAVAATDRLVAGARGGVGGDGEHQRVLDSPLRTAGVLRHRGLAGQRPAVALRSGPQVRHAGLPVDSVAAQLRLAAGIVPSARDHRPGEAHCTGN